MSPASQGRQKPTRQKIDDSSSNLPRWLAWYAHTFIPQQRRRTQTLEERVAEAIFWFVFLLGLAITGGLIAQSAYAFSVRSDIRWQVFGLLNVYALASFFVGGFFGFIFGVPRTGAMTEGRDPVLPNTNLEQISDWLTKVLVGATLANMNEIPSGGDSIFTAMGQALGTGASGKAFASGLTIFAAVLGFMSSWLATRGLMGRVLLAADLGGQPRGRQRDHKEQDAEVDGVSTTSQ